MFNQIIHEDLDSIVRESLSDLERVVNSHVVLTGASGFIGTWLSLSFLHARKALRGNGTIVFCCRNATPLLKVLSEANFKDGFEIVESDVRQFPAGVIKDETLIIHAATPARASLNSNNPLEMLDIIEQGQRRLLDLCAKQKSVRFLFLSSGAVYGQQPMNLAGFPESWNGAPEVTNPENAYHEGKRVAEIMGFIYAKTFDIQFVSARLFAFLAPFLPLNEHFAAGNFIGNAIGGNPIIIKSGGGSIRSYQYATDLCADIWSLLNRGVSGEAYNVGSDSQITIKQLAETIAELVSPGLKVVIKGVDTPSNVNRYVPDISKMKNVSMRTSNLPIDIAIRRTASYEKLLRDGS